jgi:hypothetical protein
MRRGVAVFKCVFHNKNEKTLTSSLYLFEESFGIKLRE